MIPAHDLETARMLAIIRDPRQAARLAERSRIRIPEAAAPMGALIERNQWSGLPGCPPPSRMHALRGEA